MKLRLFPLLVVACPCEIVFFFKKMASKTAWALFRVEVKKTSGGFDALTTIHPRVVSHSLLVKEVHVASI